MPIIGGLGTVMGPLIGAVVYTYIREQLSATFANLDLLTFGVLLIAIVVFEPRGILGIVDRLRKRRARADVTPVPADG
jgi:branched-chain amino acid transport system permease protein